MLPRLRDDPRYLRRFQSEASLAAGLHHTNIVGIFDYGEQDGVCYYAMQLIEGQPLDRVLADIRLLREGSQQGDPESGSSGLRITPAAGSAAARGLLTGRFAVAMTADAVADATLPIGVSDPEATGSFAMGAEAMEPADRAVGSAVVTRIVDAGPLGRAALLPRDRSDWRPGGRRPGIRPPPPHRPSRHQAVEPAARRPGQRLGDRLRPVAVRRGRRPDPVARAGGDAPLHGARAAPRRRRTAAATCIRWGRPCTRWWPCARPSRRPTRSG